MIGIFTQNNKNTKMVRKQAQSSAIGSASKRIHPSDVYVVENVVVGEYGTLGC
jgi:hypothetical protein